MLKNYFIFAWRGVLKDKISFLVNVIGLVTGFTLFAFATAFSSYEANYDGFFKNADNIEVVNTELKPGNYFGLTVVYTTFPGMVDMIQDSIPEISAATRVATYTLATHHLDKHLPVDYRFVDASFFDMFDLNILAGDVSRYGADQNIVALSKSEATRWFGSVDAAIGQDLRLSDDRMVKIVAIFQDLPDNSHFKNNGLDAILPIDLYEPLTNRRAKGEWDNLSNSIQTYIQLVPGVSKTLLQNKMNDVLSANLDQEKREIFTNVILRPLQDMNILAWERTGVPALLIAKSVGILILGIAVLNSISLSSARMLDRSREIGLRRIFGATPTQLSTQFIMENILYALLALMFAMMLLIDLTPWVADLLGKNFIFNDLISLSLVIELIMVALFVGLLSSAYPVFLFNGLIRGITLHRSIELSHSATWLRKSLVTLQFTVVSALLLAVVVVIFQNRHLLETSFEPETSHLAVVEGIDVERSNLIAEQIERLDGVKSVSRTNLPPFSTELSISIFRNQVADDDLQMQRIIVDGNYMKQIGIDLLAGRYLSKTQSGDELVMPANFESDTEINVNVVINESAVALLGLGSVEDAIGKSFYQGQNRNIVMTVAGVVPDLRLGGPMQAVMPSVFYISPRNFEALVIAFNSAEAMDLKSVENIAGQIFPGRRVGVLALDIVREQAFETLSRTTSAIFGVALVAIILALAGLYSLTAFLSASRRREIGVRKVLGASSAQIVRLLLWQFTRPVILSLIAGLPISWYLLTTKYLELFPSRIELGGTLLGMTAITTVSLVAVTSCYHVLKTARTHPAIVLRCD
ncbi:FtsX-like permease family protein [Pseudemcibacter aquimaris]|uniref:FtsX-like permease family protein n=1 Tax=Pseudemcibacter aquimaris TaxID=2857064 RepID=UPI0020111D2C|nr:FtsX-like permease family protein [Pseudemcibacter aquimaris]MCC3859922.1 FtsX-like permease family protein [Pseudemcibacter aquimaris]WDU57254.1 FtsX-like permease family protein [Pseudemcibacter aquimaris]